MEQAIVAAREAARRGIAPEVRPDFNTFAQNLHKKYRHDISRHYCAV